MGKVKVTAFTISLDGYGAGPGQTLEQPMGVGAEHLHTWMRTTKMFHQMMGKEGGTEGLDNDIANSSMAHCGAWIMGRNMFGPIRGPWPDNEWQGWWGPEPPYHCPVFVLTNHAREPLEMKGGTTFYFITDGIVSALEKAKDAANGKDIRIGGGTSTIRQYLQAGLIDEIQLTISPVLLGSGEHLLEGLDLPKLGFNEVEKINGEQAMHVVLRKK
ncbi:dihydrofolate reductase family protein [Terrimonas sp. NA20]|uniref:Dihydrofolate reductase family protein n=1 Tax=Terrimonas ginsenosidimutans TaxID=2908004 RepID=A0ABS9KRV3_9BACT|nr:dihydrofolate reductase family protein [Terrimonas ginsenosidimutans]MCG2615068.1 dihydrofolate reductase family protein [Terrimonas ginsenosidimutans]